MPENFILEREVKNGIAIRGDYIYWDGAIYILEDFLKPFDMVDLSPVPRLSLPRKTNNLVEAKSLYRVILETSEKIYDPVGSIIQIGSYVSYHNASEWQVMAFVPVTEEVYIAEVGTSLSELKAVIQQDIRVLPLLSDKYGQIIRKRDQVIFDRTNYIIHHLDIRRQTLVLTHEQSGSQEIVAASTVELVESTSRFNQDYL